MSTVVPLLFHGTAASIMLWAYNSLSLSPMHPLIMARKGGHWGFLTIQGLVFASITIWLGLICDLLPSFAVAKTGKRYFQMISIALACTISCIYWGLILTAPHLILPRLPVGDNSFGFIPGETTGELVVVYIPLHLDLALHAVPGISMALDFLLFEKKYTWHEMWMQAPGMVLLFVFWYGGLTEYLGELNDGIFPYPFLTVNPLPIRVAIYCGAGTLAYLSFLFLNAIHPGGKAVMAKVGMMHDDTTSVDNKQKTK
ncbi:hypothetical protein DACRYDRAFT_20009 [Dacryopinax primogenitus]|uniref:FAR-17a/AIG1-like protein n=1 Tax=Dacryopinax primogenitus (strain DJM 731) TaxID=1858805 RepID=M5GEN7_DACPD|nr:uncharacterized protein DACRYDRAFT_20009 [Dacryopinax primogenitus]EJU05567.1 hypothetical protein DACRYDRAFT_20009 [Dacryopinax primogenitus]